ncbi:uncharacterized protein ASPGLDRAFT_350161 [Aspergillus glaucus CBS 516.65]|uniref:Uncharacterized protein n=1 Tax=Aspergillus glaucus CBS 516.65 TaxID=1160497 RepID=A0A1L9VIZ2_ASPGL|nr:hypothetical protein ASPGLDRAFT_350161 [Aspergillus glaucus CBS 516.65]OJJ83852.1 hypothetical protein ASPGLDRAFT_350161 [Aspergillus glaucus CBS 516.65]
MSNLTTDLSRKEPSTNTLLEQARETPHNVREELSDADAQNTTGVAADRSRAPVDQDLEKGSVHRAQVDRSSSLKSIERRANYSGIH